AVQRGERPPEVLVEHVAAERRLSGGRAAGMKRDVRRRHPALQLRIARNRPHLDRHPASLAFAPNRPALSDSCDRLVTVRRETVGGCSATCTHAGGSVCVWPPVSRAADWDVTRYDRLPEAL